MILESKGDNMSTNASDSWNIGEMRNEGDPVLIRHRLRMAETPDNKHDWLVIVTHHLREVQANGLPEPDYNDRLIALDNGIIAMLEEDAGNMVILIETCHGKRNYYAYVHNIDDVGRSVSRLVDSNTSNVFSYRTMLDPTRRFVHRYIATLADDRD